MTTIRTITLQCPNCRAKFETNSLGSTNTFGRRSTDLWQMASGAQPILFVLHTCNSCGCSGFQEDFEKLVLMGTPKNQVNAKLTPIFRAEHPAPTSRRYEYAAWLAIWRSKSETDIGQLYHTAAWCCRLEDNQAEEPRYLELAAAHFEKAIRNAAVQRDEIALYTYLIAELNRRLARLSKATDWFLRAEKAQKSFGGPQFIATLAVKQRLDPTEWIE